MTPLNRRTILGLIPAAAAGAATISPAAVLAEVGRLGPIGGAVMVGVAGEPAASSWTPGRRLISGLWRQREWSQRDQRHMDPDISTKRSWSPAYKHHVWVEREREYQAAIDRLEADQALAERVASLLGFRA